MHRSKLCHWVLPARQHPGLIRWERLIYFQEAVHRVFPGAVLPLEPFDGYVELLGLPNNTAPLNCEVLVSGQFQNAFNEKHRSSYLVRGGDLVLRVHMCPDASNSINVHVALR